MTKVVDYKATETKAQRDARRKREKRREAKAESFRKLTPEEMDQVVAMDDPVPIRLSVVTLAQSFAEACATLAEAEQAFDRALAARARARAKAALDAEITRLANEVT